MKLHDYQQAAVSFAMNRLYVEDHSGAGLLLEPGLGKTITTLTIIARLRDLGEVQRVLIAAPLRVLDVWLREIEKWQIDLTASIVHGTASQRSAALAANTDLFLINYENLPWLARQRQQFDLLIADESTKLKNWSAARSKAIRKMLPTKRLILTGTPAPNSLADMFSQIYLLDDGQALGNTIGKFRDRWMRRGGFENRQWLLRDDSIESLQQLIAPMCLYQSAVEHLDMPELIVNEIAVELPPEARKIYRSMEDAMFAEIDDDPLLAMNSGAKYNACRQIANGNVYVDGDARSVHSAKADALRDLIEELNGKPLLVGYQFKHDIYGYPSIDGSTSRNKSRSLINSFSRGELPVLACQTQALSHGVDGLQGACSDICWVGLTDSGEVHSQFNARVYRQGQVEKHVRIHYLIASNTVDRAIMRRLHNKDQSQKSLLESIKEYRNVTN